MILFRDRSSSTYFCSKHRSVGRSVGRHSVETRHWRDDRTLANSFFRRCIAFVDAFLSRRIRNMSGAVDTRALSDRGRDWAGRYPHCSLPDWLPIIPVRSWINCSISCSVDCRSSILALRMGPANFRSDKVKHVVVGWTDTRLVKNLYIRRVEFPFKAILHACLTTAWRLERNADGVWCRYRQNDERVKRQAFVNLAVFMRRQRSAWRRYAERSLSSV